MIVPPRLRPGDRVAVIAPAGPIPRATFAAGAARLAERYRLVYDEALFSRDGYLAGDDARRAAELQHALDDPSVSAVYCARGGYGVMRLLGALDLAKFARAPRPVIGFSDITALHAACAHAGVVTLHAPTLSHLGALAAEYTDDLVARLESPEPPPAWTALASIAPGRGTGRAVGGNLEITSRLLGTRFAFPLDGNVLFLEDVGERPYRIDRTLTQLELAGASRLAAVVVGDLTRCVEPDGDALGTNSEGGEGPLVADVVAERLRRWHVPVVAGAPFGHGERNRAFPLGGRVTVDADRGTVTFLDGAVVS